MSRRIYLLCAFAITYSTCHEKITDDGQNPPTYGARHGNILGSGIIFFGSCNGHSSCPEFSKLLIYLYNIMGKYQLELVSKGELNEEINAVRAKKKKNIRVVLTREEVRQILTVMQGVPHFITKILYGRGLRVMEAVRIRVEEINNSRKHNLYAQERVQKIELQLSHKPSSLFGTIISQKAKTLHEQDLTLGYGAEYLPLCAFA